MKESKRIRILLFHRPVPIKLPENCTVNGSACAAEYLAYMPRGVQDPSAKCPRRSWIYTATCGTESPAQNFSV